MSQEKLNEMQKVVCAHYCQGEYADLETAEEVEQVGDLLFQFLVLEAEEVKTLADLQDRLQTAMNDIQNMGDSIEDAVSSGEMTTVPLAERYAHKVITNPADVVQLEIEGVRYTSPARDNITVDNEAPDFFTVYARIRCPVGEGVQDLAAAVGDFMDVDACRHYAGQLINERYKRPEWPLVDRYYEVSGK
jgi:hypothetical protein